MDYNYFFSIIIPIYNKGAYLDRCLTSILQQTYNNFEVIMIDDGSNDNSSKIANKFIKQDNRFSYYYHSNHGVSYSRNIGIKKSKGQYILFIDADDSLNNEYLNNIWESINKAPHYPLYIFSLTKIYPNGHKEKLPLPYHGKISTEQLKKTFITIQEATGLYGFVCNKAIAKDFLLENNIDFDTTQKLAEDLNFYVKCYHKIKFIFFIDEYGYNYYQSTLGSSTKNNNIDYLSLINIYLKIYIWLIHDTEEKEFKKLVHKIQSLICSSFLEMKALNFKQINQYTSYYLTEPNIKFILNNKTHHYIILYLLKYNLILFLYLLIRKIYVYVKLRIIRSWRKF